MTIRKFRCLPALSLSLVTTLVSTSVLAGGDFWGIQVTSFRSDPDRPDAYVFQATVVTTFSYGSDCDQVTVHGNYDLNRWRKYQRPMSITTHELAIDRLKSALASGETIGFGVIGAGLKKLETCVYESKGMFVEAVSGSPVVFSVHFPI